MAKICYVEKNFKPKTLQVIEQANDIIEEFQNDGYELTLRQLYYQFVSKDLIPNNMREYKNLGAIINDARLAGLIDWNAIEDRTRNLQTHSSWDSPAEILNSAASGFQVDMWENQDNYVEVWVEKDALIGVVETACEDRRVPYFSCRGYSSQSEQHAAGMRLASKIRIGKTVHVLHLGDHDPSGIDMTRDNEDRLRMFIGHRGDADAFEIHRLALNIDQVRKYNPPPNFAKVTDKRSDGYIRKFGTDCWELDALSPKVIADIINTNVENLIDFSQWSEDEERESGFKSKLRDIANQDWEE